MGVLGFSPGRFFGFAPDPSTALGISPAGSCFAHARKAAQLRLCSGHVRCAQCKQGWAAAGSQRCWSASSAPLRLPPFGCASLGRTRDRQGTFAALSASKQGRPFGSPQVRCPDSGGVHRTPETGGRPGPYRVPKAVALHHGLPFGSAPAPSATLGISSAGSCFAHARNAAQLRLRSGQAVQAGPKSRLARGVKSLMV
jgi:hypothetical protein